MAAAKYSLVSLVEFSEFSEFVAAAKNSILFS